MVEIRRNADGDSYMHVSVTPEQRAALMRAARDGGGPCVITPGRVVRFNGIPPSRVECSDDRDEVMGCRGSGTTPAGDVAACGAVLIGLLCVPVAVVIVVWHVVKWLVTR